MMAKVDFWQRSTEKIGSNARKSVSENKFWSIFDIFMRRKKVLWKKVLNFMFVAAFAISSLGASISAPEPGTIHPVTTGYVTGDTGSNGDCAVASSSCTGM
ncbi:MAG: hypothetical protein KC418_09235 [Anaerolineales bacterium]|nr:hypothetical protein [Anaerolineales bacterium]MCB8954465.1 hypothetical protein [Ardenticatenales bacterium]